MKKYTDKEIGLLLKESRVNAPDGLRERIMDTVSKGVNKNIWCNPIATIGFRGKRWVLPAVAAAMLIAVFTGMPPRKSMQNSSSLNSQFKFYAPDATSVELVGSFNQWRRNDILLKCGGNGFWTADITLNEGRHEYQFVVNGTKWIADPMALAFRADGFGGQNAVLEI